MGMNTSVARKVCLASSPPTSCWISQAFRLTVATSPLAKAGMNGFCTSCSPIVRRPSFLAPPASTIRMSSSSSSAGGRDMSWPSPETFNALPLSTRTKMYSDFGDAGKMTWVSHEDPPKHPLPPFTAETALQKTKAAEAAWNTKDPAKVAAAYSPDTVWRNRDEIFAGRNEVQAFLTRKWSKEQGYRLKKHLWAFEGNRISARFEYEWHDENGQWYRTHGNEHWEFDEQGYMRWRDMSADDIPIDKNERRLT